MKKCSTFPRQVCNISASCLNISKSVPSVCITREEFLNFYPDYYSDVNKENRHERNIRDMEIIITLLSRGVDHTIKNKDKNSCIDYISTMKSSQEKEYALGKMKSVIQNRWNITALLLRENSCSDDLIKLVFSFCIDEENDPFEIEKALSEEVRTKLIKSKFELENDTIGYDLIECQFNDFNQFGSKTKEEFLQFLGFEYLDELQKNGKLDRKNQLNIGEKGYLYHKFNCEIKKFLDNNEPIDLSSLTTVEEQIFNNIIRKNFIKPVQENFDNYIEFSKLKPDDLNLLYQITRPNFLEKDEKKKEEWYKKFFLLNFSLIKKIEKFYLPIETKASFSKRIKGYLYLTEKELDDRAHFCFSMNNILRRKDLLKKMKSIGRKNIFTLSAIFLSFLIFYKMNGFSYFLK